MEVKEEEERERKRVNGPHETKTETHLGEDTADEMKPMAAITEKLMEWTQHGLPYGRQKKALRGGENMILVTAMERGRSYNWTGWPEETDGERRSGGGGLNMKVDHAC